MARTARQGEYSEGESLSRIIGLAEQVRTTVRAYTAIKGVQADAMSHAATLLAELMGVARSLLGQVAKGVHTNPPLVVYGLNPPRRNFEAKRAARGIMSHRVLGLEYKHARDREDYRHDFSRGVQMYALDTGDILLTHEKGVNLWKEFPE
jgi:hypothetical protein